MGGVRVAAVSDFDYVIVGAGSAGCVLANRLSSAGAEVLLIEAGGGDRSLKMKIPAAFPDLFKTSSDWDYESGPEPGCEGRMLYVPRGRAIGGSSSINAMLYVRGHRADYDSWRDDAGCAGWGWDDVLPYFVRSESHAGGPGQNHGYGGLLHVEPQRSPRPLTTMMLDACRALGLPTDPDYNDGEPFGAGIFDVTQRHGRRWSAADAFLRPVRGLPNLTVMTGAFATGVELRDGRAVGVRVAGDTAMAVARAREEVILSAGAIGSPQLLLLSGIGDPEELAAVGVEAKVASPSVGSNLQDHPYVSAIWESRIGGSLADAEQPSALLEYLLRRSGPLTSTIAESFLFVHSSGSSAEPPDLQFHFAPAYFSENGFDERDGHAFTFGPVLVAPKARGKLTLRSADPTTKPRMIGNHLTEQADVDAIVAGIELAREIAASGPLAAAAGPELHPGKGVRDRDQLAAHVRRHVELLYHPVGTCRMGADDESVVDPELRVRGVDGLRIADASVMPTIVRGNTNAPTLMVAEKAADMILSNDPPPARAD